MTEMYIYIEKKYMNMYMYGRKGAVLPAGVHFWRWLGVFSVVVTGWGGSTSPLVGEAKDGSEHTARHRQSPQQKTVQ